MRKIIRCTSKLKHGSLRGVRCVFLGMLFTSGLAFGCGGGTEPAISGMVWEDENDNGVLDEGEPGIPDVVMYLDGNDNGGLDAGELSSTTDSGGRYEFASVVPGTYTLQQVVTYGWRQGRVPGARAEVARNLQAPYIIGGVDVPAQGYPFMVSIGVDEGDGFRGFCGGALLTDKHVVTAAHCTNGFPERVARVRIGSDRNTTGGVVLRIADKKSHPQFNGVSENGFDIAIWTLEERLDLEAMNVHSVAMVTPQTEDLAVPGNIATTIGWGVSDSDSAVLQEIQVPILSSAECSGVYPLMNNFETQVCAGDLQLGGLDSCQGDSGGPLLVRDSEVGRWMYAGTTSWGLGCAAPQNPGVYARSSALWDWAEEQLIEEPTQAYTLILSDNNSGATLNISNRRTTREQIGDVPVGLSISALAAVEFSDNRTPANTAFILRYSFYRAGGKGTEDSVCRYDLDGVGPGPGTVVDCEPGQNSLTIPGIGAGVYLPQIEVRIGDTTRSQSTVIAVGTVPTAVFNGSISAGTPDPDVAGTYYIDYFELTELQAGEPVMVEVESEIGVDVGLYDADQRTASGGGKLGFSTGVEGRAVLGFVPELGRRYWIGVRTQSEQRRGSYLARVLNNGTPIAR